MTLLRRMALIAVGAIAFAVAMFSPNAAAYIFPQVPAAKTVMVERVAPTVPVMADAALRFLMKSGAVVPGSQSFVFREIRGAK